MKACISIVSSLTTRLPKRHFSASKPAYNRTSSLQTYNSADPKYAAFNPESPVCSWNEWDTLKEVMVGQPEMTIVPEANLELLATLDKSQHDFYRQYGGRYWADAIGKEAWQKILDNINEFKFILEQEGVKVVQPDEYDHQKQYQHPYFTSRGMYAAMPRDILMVVGDEIIEGVMGWRNRFFEYIPFRRVIRDYWRRGAKWTAAPKISGEPGLYNENYQLIEGERLSRDEQEYVLTEQEVVFDTADFVRAGKDIFGVRSHTTNYAGIEWLRRHVAPKGIRVHEMEFTDPYQMHIDATFFPLKPGIFLKHPKYQCKQMDALLKTGWKIYEFPKPMVDASKILMASGYLAMNFLMLDENRAFIEKGEDNLAKMLEGLGITPVKVNFKEAFSLGGGFHCWTCDIRRDGVLQDYFS